MTIDWMLVVLGLVALLVAVSVWRAHRTPEFAFNVFDLLMENGRVSKIAVAFMLVLGVTTWVIINLTVKDKMTEGYLTTYGAMWVAPILVKVLSKSEPPAPPVDGSTK
jgi:hypothetical protein